MISLVLYIDINNDKKDRIGFDKREKVWCLVMEFVGCLIFIVFI